MGSSDLLLSTRLRGVAFGERVFGDDVFGVDAFGVDFFGVDFFGVDVFGVNVFAEALCSIETGDFTSFDFIFD